MLTICLAQSVKNGVKFVKLKINKVLSVKIEVVSCWESDNGRALRHEL